MTNRREFLQTGVSVSALPLALHGLLSAETARARSADERTMLEAVVVDDRYAEALRFADALGVLGVPAQSLRDGDVTDSYLALERLWRERPVAIAGLTQFGPMFVLERLGREHGLRVALRAEHRVNGDGTLAHVIGGAPDTLAFAETLQRESPDWPVLTAMLAASCRGAGAATRECTIATPGGKPRLRRSAGAPKDPAPDSVIHYYRQFALQEGREIPWDGPLFSWVIAPRARA